MVIKNKQLKIRWRSFAYRQALQDSYLFFFFIQFEDELGEWKEDKKKWSFDIPNKPLLQLVFTSN